MSSISGIGGYIFFPQAPAATGQSGSGTAAGSATTPAVFGGAFELTLSQQTGADGSESDDVSFEGYVNNPNSGGTTVFGAEGKGNNAQSAFEAMIASFDGLGASTGSGSGSGTAGVGGELQNLSNLFANLIDPSTSGSGTGGTAARTDTDTSAAAATASGANSSGSGSGSASLDNPMQLISVIVVGNDF